MYKRIYLIRHAKSSWANPDTPDFDRPLNKRGLQDAPFMGARLSKFGVQPDLILSSPAKRAIKTARLIAGGIGFSKMDIVENMKIYGADVDTLLDMLHQIYDHCKEVILVGHNPGLTRLAEALTRYELENIPTCGIFCVEFQAKRWSDVKKGMGAPVFMDYPKKHK